MGGFIKKAIVAVVLLIAAIVGAAIYFGVIDSRDITTPARVQASQLSAKASEMVDNIGSSGGGATKGGTPKQAAQCRANLKRIESAKKAAAKKSGISVGSISKDKVLKELGGKVPVCPVGGSYSLGTLQIQARCSVGGNGTADAADDHLLANF